MISASSMLLAAVSLSQAAPTQPAAVMETENILSMLFSLLTVLAVVVLLAWLWRRMMPGAVQANRMMRVLSTQHIGSKEKLMLLHVADEVLLLGVTSQQISTLARFPETQFDSSELQPSMVSPALAKLLSQRKKP